MHHPALGCGEAPDSRLGRWTRHPVAVDDTVAQPMLTLGGYDRHGRIFWNLPVARFSIYPTVAKHPAHG